MVEGLDVIGVESLQEAYNFLEGRVESEPTRINIREEFIKNLERYDMNFSDVKGQEKVKRALMIAATCMRHNDRCPGSGKTMLDKRMPTILI